MPEAGVAPRRPFPARPAAVLLLALCAGLLPGGEPPAAPARSPEAFLGFRPGADRQLVDWSQAVAYLRELDAAAPRLSVSELGRTTGGRPLLLLTLTSERNQARLEEIRRDHLRLWDPRGLSEGEAEALVARGRNVVALTHGIHSNEAASLHTALETAWRLATSDEPLVREILDETVVLLVPSQNPDGTDLVADWYRGSLGTPWEGTSPPRLYHPYAGHDNNRDGYAFTQQETRLLTAGLHDRWRPTIVHDLHQMGRNGARLFVPPYLDPWEPNVDPALRSAAGALGLHVAARLAGDGRSGVVVQALFDAWSPGRGYVHTHGGVRFLSEAAGTRLATPVEVAAADLRGGRGYDPRRASWNQPLPWPGGAWRLRDAVDYQLSASFALLEHAARLREFWLRQFLAVNRRACRAREPRAYVVPAAQADPAAALVLLRTLRTGAVELGRATRPFEAGGRRYAAGSHVVALEQPASAFARTVLERQQYPDLREDPSAAPVPPYDVTAHTLPLLMGVDVRAVPEGVAAPLEAVAEPRAARPARPGPGRWLAFGHRTGELQAAVALLQRGLPVEWALEGFERAGRRFPAGTLLSPRSAREALQPLADERGFGLAGLDQLPPRRLRLRLPRVGVYQSWVPALDEGWTRFVLERQMGLPFATLHDADVRRGGLEARLDALVLADQPRGEIVAGHAPGQMPDEYTGGLGATGLEQLRQFARAGGTLLLVNRAAELAWRDLGMPVRNALQGLEASDFSAPGSLLRAQADLSQPLAQGLDPAPALWFESGPAFELLGEGRAVLRYEEPEPLLSGWLTGGRRLQGRAALVELPLGRGRVVLYGFRPQYRGQSWATYPALVNALLLSAARPAP